MSSRIRRDEFEGRNRQLPASLNQSAIYGLSQKSRDELQQTPLGTPPDCYDVRSVYDSRPVNASDFNIVNSFNFVGGEAPITTALIEMVVPEGYVGVLRKVHLWFEPVYGQNRSDVTASFILNGADVPYNLDIPVGGDTDDLANFVIGSEFNRLGLRVTLNDGLLEDDDFVCYVHFYGNFLLKSNRPLPAEIANPSLDAKCTTPAMRAPTPVKAPPPVKVSVIEPIPTPVAPTVIRAAPEKLCKVWNPRKMAYEMVPCPKVGLIKLNAP